VETILGNNNLIVHQLLDEPETVFPVLLTLMKKANNAVVASFRSKKGEALEFATKLQGGGHPNACGATLPRSVKSISEALDFLKKTFNPPRPQQSADLNSLADIFSIVDQETQKG
jgi:hypothetical protein